MVIERKIKLLIATATLVMGATAIVPFKTAEKATQLQEALLQSEARTIEIRRTEGNDAARASVSTGRGKLYMNDIRVEVAAVTAVEHDLSKAKSSAS